MTIIETQRALQTLGFKITMIDGIKGPETTKAIKDFQYTWGLDTDGIVGPDTSSAIQDVLNMMYEEGWNPLSDPQEYTGTTYGTYAPETVFNPQYHEPATPSAQPTTIVNQTGLAGIDWKWIALGVGASILIFKSIKR